ELPLQTTLKIYNILGEDVATLVNEILPAGNYEREWNATQSPSGLYFYKLTAGKFSETKKLLLLK
ncbi:MAG: T9SS type A sorting domain-containing protein, partial [Ignavibacteria bacterium]|nr:T9SS type A sorting domain-containing protein [Ignavibacteria bacterium]